MKKPLMMQVTKVNVQHTAPGDWSAEVTFGIPGQEKEDDPTLTVHSGEALELPPKVGDWLRVRPPEIVGYESE